MHNGGIRTTARVKPVEFFIEIVFWRVVNIANKSRHETNNCSLIQQHTASRMAERAGERGEDRCCSHWPPLAEPHCVIPMRLLNSTNHRKKPDENVSERSSSVPIGLSWRFSLRYLIALHYIIHAMYFVRPSSCLFEIMPVRCVEEPKVLWTNVRPTNDIGRNVYALGRRGTKRERPTLTFLMRAPCQVRNLPRISAFDWAAAKSRFTRHATLSDRRQQCNAHLCINQRRNRRT